MANKLPSILSSGNNQYLTPSLSFNRVATDFVTPGIVGAPTNTSLLAPMTGAFAVNAQGSPNMTVAVNSGVIYLSAAPTGGSAQMFSVTMDVSENVTISSNATGSTVYDFLYLKLDADKLNNPAANGLDVPTLVTQRSTSQASDSNGALANAILLAVVTVTNGAVSIANSNIQDYRQIASALDIDGWMSANESWAFASATTITVPTGATGRYSVGDKIRLIQAATIKYFYIVGVAATTLTITGGTDYTLTNNPILFPSYSKVATPTGFPQWFNYTPTFVGWSATPGLTISKFAIIGRIVTVELVTTNTTSNATTTTLTLPIASAANTIYAWLGHAVDGSADTLAMYALASSSNLVTAFKITSVGTPFGAWTASGTKGVRLSSFSYEI